MSQVGFATDAATSTDDLSGGFVGLTRAQANSVFRDVDRTLDERATLAALTSANRSGVPDLISVPSLRALISFRPGLELSVDSYAGQRIWIPESVATPTIISEDSRGAFDSSFELDTLAAAPVYGYALAAGEFLWATAHATNAEVSVQWLNGTNFGSTGTMTNGATSADRGWRDFRYSEAYGKYYRRSESGVVSYATSLGGTWTSLGSVGGASSTFRCVGVDSAGDLILFNQSGPDAAIIRNLTTTGYLAAGSLNQTYLSVSYTVKLFAWLAADRMYVVLGNITQTGFLILRSGLRDYLTFTPVFAQATDTSAFVSAGCFGSSSEKVIGFSEPGKYFYYSLDDGETWARRYLGTANARLVGNRLWSSEGYDDLRVSGWV